MLSSILGICALNLRPLSGKILQGVAAYRSGPQSTSCLPDCIILVENSTAQQSPLSVGYISIVATSRLDNKAELLEKLGSVKRSPNSELTEAEIIAFAYLKWGTECVTHLLGDFAFALWDAREKRLFCARDHFGMRPLYYATVNDTFVFSSSLDWLVNFPSITKKVNEERVLDYIVSVCLDNTSTFYQNIFRLPPAHCIIVHNNSVELGKYWEYEFSPLSYRKDSDYAEAFREIFSTAVESRIHSSKIAITLSGGLDSTSVACLAEKKLTKEGNGPLKIYSGIFEKFLQCDEQEYIRETLQTGDFDWRTLVVDRIDPLASLFEMAEVHQEPWFAPHLYMTWNLLQAMKMADVELLLDGHDGDSVVSNDLGRLVELIDNRKFFVFAKELFLAHRIIIPSEQARALRLFFTRNLRNYLKRWSPLYSWFQPQNAYRQPPPPPFFNALTGACREPFLQRVGAAGRIEIGNKYLQKSSQQRVNHQNHVFHPIQPFALEVLGRSAAAFGVEYRCPFWDKRVVEFCLSLPAEQKFQNGWPRSILRRGMAGIIPKKIQWRADKTDFSPDMANVRDLLFQEKGSGTLFDQCRQELSCWIDFEKLTEYYTNHPEKKNLALFDVWKLLTLYAWLKTTGLKVS